MSVRGYLLGCVQSVNLYNLSFIYKYIIILRYINKGRHPMRVYRTLTFRPPKYIIRFIHPTGFNTVLTMLVHYKKSIVLRGLLVFA